MITLVADSKAYGNTGQYIARITGRDKKFGWKLKLMLHYCGLWQHQRQTCGNCNNAVATEGDWCKSCLAQAREWNRQFPDGPLKGGR